MISDAYFEVEVIGEFPEGEARAFFEWRLQFSVEAPPPLDDASWARIYEVMAGGPSCPQWEDRVPFTPTRGGQGSLHEGRAGGPSCPRGGAGGPSEVEGVVGALLSGKGRGPFRHQEG